MGAWTAFRGGRRLIRRAGQEGLIYEFKWVEKKRGKRPVDEKKKKWANFGWEGL